MSVLSTQCDELRDKALLFEGYNNGEISRMLREAADTIESLRDRLQDAALDSRCFNLRADSEYDEFECSECGHVDGPYCYAPEVGEHCKGCGREVVER